jgi:hypothetical protein
MSKKNKVTHAGGMTVERVDNLQEILPEVEKSTANSVEHTETDTKQMYDSFFEKLIQKLGIKPSWAGTRHLRIFNSEKGSNYFVVVFHPKTGLVGCEFWMRGKRSFTEEMLERLPSLGLNEEVVPKYNNGKDAHIQVSMETKNATPEWASKTLKKMMDIINPLLKVEETTAPAATEEKKSHKGKARKVAEVTTPTEEHLDVEVTDQGAGEPLLIK